MAKSFINGTIFLDSSGQGFAGRPNIDYSVNPDGTWVTNPATQVKSTQMRSSGYTINPSAVSWSVILTDMHGNVILEASAAANSPLSNSAEMIFNGVVASTLTNASVTLHEVERIQW